MGARAAARSILLEPVSTMIGAVASEEQREAFVRTCLEGLRGR